MHVAFVNAISPWRGCVLAAGLVLATLAPLDDAGAVEAVTPVPPPPMQPTETGPVKVSVGIWLADITRIDSVAQTFSANFLLVLGWHDARLAHEETGTRRYALADVWHPPFLIVNNDGGLERSLPEMVDVGPDGEVVYRQRIVGAFAQPLNLRAFPFDHDTFRIYLVVPGYRPDDLQFVPNAKFVAEGFPNGAGIAPQLTLQDWRVASPSTRVAPYIAGPDVEVAGYAFEFIASRNARHFVVKVIIPLVLIVDDVVGGFLD